MTQFIFLSIVDVIPELKAQERSNKMNREKCHKRRTFAVVFIYFNHRINFTFIWPSRHLRYIHLCVNNENADFKIQKYHFWGKWNHKNTIFISILPARVRVTFESLIRLAADELRSIRLILDAWTSFVISFYTLLISFTTNLLTVCCSTKFALRFFLSGLVFLSVVCRRMNSLCFNWPFFNRFVSAVHSSVVRKLLQLFPVRHHLRLYS